MRGEGAVYCLDTDSGEKIWSVNFIEDLGVDSVLQFGCSESVLIDGDNLICVPGGIENNVVALNRFTGDLVWNSEGVGEIALDRAEHQRQQTARPTPHDPS